jgi:hypothetical protein
MWNTLLHHRNVGGLDRGLRLALGAAFVATGVVLASGTTARTLGIVVSLVGLGVLLSGLTARCPMYTVLGITTTGRTTGGRPCACLGTEERRREQPGREGGSGRAAGGC